MDLILKRKNKKGLTNQLVLLLVMAVVLITIFCIIFIIQLAGPPFLSTVQTAKVIVQTSIQDTNNQALINASQSSIEPALDSLNNLEWFSYAVVIVMVLGFIIMCFYVRTYPFLIFFWIVLGIICIVLSIYLTVAYQDLTANSSLNSYYSAWENTDYILRFLPIIVTAMVIMGGIIMFIISTREQEIESYNYGYGGYGI